MALVCISLDHCLRRAEARGPVGEGDGGVKFVGAKSRRGSQEQEMGPWVRAWVLFLGKLRALKGFHPHMGAWHGSGEALGTTLVSRLEKGTGRKAVRWHSFRRVGAPQLKKMGFPMAIIMLWAGGGAGRSRGSPKSIQKPPPPGGNSRDTWSSHGPGGRARMDCDEKGEYPRIVARMAACGNCLLLQ